MSEHTERHAPAAFSRKGMENLVVASLRRLNDRNGSKPKNIKKCAADINGGAVAGTSVMVALKRLVNKGLLFISNGLCSLFGPPKTSSIEAEPEEPEPQESTMQYECYCRKRNRRRKRKVRRSRSRRRGRGNRGCRRRKSRRSRSRSRQRRRRIKRTPCRQRSQMKMRRSRKRGRRCRTPMSLSDCNSCSELLDKRFSSLKRPGNSTRTGNVAPTQSRVFSTQCSSRQSVVSDRDPPKKRGRKPKNEDLCAVNIQKRSRPSTSNSKRSKSNSRPSTSNSKRSKTNSRPSTSNSKRSTSSGRGGKQSISSIPPELQVKLTTSQTRIRDS